MSTLPIPLSVLKNCARCCAQSYEGDTVSDLPTDSHCLISQTADSVIIAFRGTKDPKQWLEDAEFWRIPITAAGSIHAGFMTCVRAMRDRVLAALPVLSQPKDIIITGHSMGAAIAMEFARQARFLIPSGPIAHVIPIACPRVGDAAWADAYNRALGPCTWRVINRLDIVCRAPGLLAGYRHAGNEIMLDQTGQPLVNPPLWLKLLADAWAIYTDKSKAITEPLTDHFIGHYVSRIEALAE